jgi:hypothetical protein
MEQKIVLLSAEAVTGTNDVLLQLSDDAAVLVNLLPTVMKNSTFTYLICFTEFYSDRDEVSSSIPDLMV